jgi:hypothetical protein
MSVFLNREIVIKEYKMSLFLNLMILSGLVSEHVFLK